MNKEVVKQNGLEIIKIYCPNLLEFISDDDFLNYIDKAIDYTEPKGGTAHNSFIVTFDKLIKFHFGDDPDPIIKEEFGYFNHLLGEFKKLDINSKPFIQLLNSILLNFRYNNFLNAISEISVCLTLSRDNELICYEETMPNSKQIDFVFKMVGGELIYIDVLSINFDPTEYKGKEGFETRMCNKITNKHESKTVGLNSDLANQIFVFTVVHGVTKEMVKENFEFLNRIKWGSCKNSSVKSFNPRFFGNIQGTYFNLFTVEDVVKLT